MQYPEAATQKDVHDPRSPSSLAQKLESWVQRAQQDCDPDEFLQQLHNYKLPAWDHYTHIRIAYVLLKNYGRQKGKQYFRANQKGVGIDPSIKTGKNVIFDGIEAYIKNSSQTTGRTFHVTMTYFWIQTVHFAMVSMEISSGEQVVDDFTAFLIFNPYLCDGMLWNDYYRKERIMTLEAQQGMILPDKKALPDVISPETVRRV